MIITNFNRAGINKEVDLNLAGEYWNGGGGYKTLPNKVLSKFLVSNRLVLSNMLFEKEKTFCYQESEQSD